MFWMLDRTLTTTLDVEPVALRRRNDQPDEECEEKYKDTISEYQ